MVIWIRLVRGNMSWYNAKQNCEQMGAKLFSDIDGTIEQLHTIGSRLDFNVWLGIYRTTEVSPNWITTQGENVPENLLRWDLNDEPDLGHQRFAVIWSNADGTQYFHDIEADSLYQSVCDLRWNRWRKKQRMQLKISQIITVTNLRFWK